MNLVTITSLAVDFLDKSPLNRVKELGIERIYDIPLVGAARADDPLFAKLKEPEVVGPHHLLPSEWLPGARAALSYFLPYSWEIREANRSPGLPDQKWLYGRIECEAVNNALREYLAAELAREGHHAVVPPLDPRYQVEKKRSNWSERHAAYIAGLGTFGLSKSLITEKGCAGRYGSIITDADLEITPRPYEGVYDYCNYCYACIPRCPSAAIQEEGKNILACSDYMDREIRPRFAPRYGCGKCQTAVPCEDSIPG